MRHSFIDKYAYLNSYVHRISPKFKILFSLFFITINSIIPIHYLLIFSPFIITMQIVIIYFSMIPPMYIFKKALLILPFILPVIILNSFFANYLSIAIPLLLFIRIYFNMIILLILVSTTKFYTIINTLSNWHFPNILIIISSFMYRYIFLLQDEFEKMVRAVTLRVSENKLILLKSYANIIGILFIKSFERAERIYYAMQLRGFENIYKNENNN